MSKTKNISSASEFSNLLGTSRVVVTDFYADWCGPCKQIAPIYEQLSAQLSRPSKVTFTKVNVDNQVEIAAKYQITAMPTFMIFKNKQVVETIRDADPRKLSEAVKKLAAEADSDGSSAAGGYGDSSWLGAGLPRGYGDIIDQIDLRGLDMLNAESGSGKGTSRTLFQGSKPSVLGGKEKAKGTETEDWVESDTDEQLMLYIPFTATLKVHTLHITSLPPKAEDGDEVPMRPKTLQVYSNRATVLGFSEAEDVPATQSITLRPQDWDEKTGTAKVELRFVKFQNVTSLVIFIVDGEGSGEKVRVDRIRIIGETGEKRELGKLEKVGDEAD
ncbi:hypothetical protein MMC30_002344 [Trapelia coarctata]|nr:hypothetical protein [Trapelia coarctata]